MKYEITIPTFYLIPGFILFIILFYFFIKILIEYEQEKDNLNDKWEKDKAYREFRFQKRLYGNMSQEDIDTVNNLSKEYELQQEKDFDAYFHEVRKKKEKNENI